MEIRKSEFVTKTQFLSSTLLNFQILHCFVQCGQVVGTLLFCLVWTGCGDSIVLSSVDRLWGLYCFVQCGQVVGTLLFCLVWTGCGDFIVLSSVDSLWGLYCFVQCGQVVGTLLFCLVQTGCGDSIVLSSVDSLWGLYCPSLRRKNWKSETVFHRSSSSSKLSCTCRG